MEDYEIDAQASSAGRLFRTRQLEGNRFQVAALPHPGGRDTLAPTRMFDLAIRNGRSIDGSGGKESPGKLVRNPQTEAAR